MRLLIMIAFAVLMVFPSVLRAQSQELRKGFMLGKSKTEKAYEQLSQEHARTLLTATDNDQKKALGQWFELLQEMEDYSESINFNLDGLKLLLHVFWNADGSIAHIGYFLQPESRNIKEENLSAFFSSFVRQYPPDTDLQSDKKFSHYTGVSFPTFNKRKQ